MKFSKADKITIIGVVVGVFFTIVTAWYFSSPSKAPRVKLCALSKFEKDYGRYYEPINEGYDSLLIVTHFKVPQEIFDNDERTFVLRVPFGLLRDGDRFVDKLRYQLRATPIKRHIENQVLDFPRFVQPIDSVVVPMHMVVKDLSMSGSTIQIDEYIRVFNA